METISEEALRKTISVLQDNARRERDAKEQRPVPVTYEEYCENAAAAYEDSAEQLLRLLGRMVGKRPIEDLDAIRADKAIGLEYEFILKDGFGDVLGQTKGVLEAKK